MYETLAKLNAMRANSNDSFIWRFGWKAIGKASLQSRQQHQQQQTIYIHKYLRAEHSKSHRIFGYSVWKSTYPSISDTPKPGIAQCLPVRQCSSPGKFVCVCLAVCLCVIGVWSPETKHLLPSPFFLPRAHTHIRGKELSVCIQSQTHTNIEIYSDDRDLN